MEPPSNKNKIVLTGESIVNCSFEKDLSVNHKVGNC